MKQIIAGSLNNARLYNYIYVIYNNILILECFDNQVRDQVFRFDCWKCGIPGVRQLLVAVLHSHCNTKVPVNVP